ncbi:MAG TPA: RcnB family protein [Micropepsaceae bacterium]|jgi:Ni/Co efflux regulator RcnB
MRTGVSIGFISIVAVIGLGAAPSFAGLPFPGKHSDVEKIQYDRYPDQRRDDRNDRDYRGPKWRPGQVLPGQFLNRVVGDWEERGLSRPPSGHQWVRVGQQFILVRGSDRMIARILNFD